MVQILCWLMANAASHPCFRHYTIVKVTKIPTLATFSNQLNGTSFFLIVTNLIETTDWSTHWLFDGLIRLGGYIGAQGKWQKAQFLCWIFSKDSGKKKKKGITELREPESRWQMSDQLFQWLSCEQRDLLRVGCVLVCLCVCFSVWQFEWTLGLGSAHLQIYNRDDIERRPQPRMSIYYTHTSVYITALATS